MKSLHVQFRYICKTLIYLYRYKVAQFDMRSTSVRCRIAVCFEDNRRSLICYVIVVTDLFFVQISCGKLSGMAVTFECVLNVCVSYLLGSAQVSKPGTKTVFFCQN